MYGIDGIEVAQLLDPPAASQGAEARYRYRLQCFVDSDFFDVSD